MSLNINTNLFDFVKNSIVMSDIIPNTSPFAANVGNTSVGNVSSYSQNYQNLLNNLILNEQKIRQEQLNLLLAQLQLIKDSKEAKAKEAKSNEDKAKEDKAKEDKAKEDKAKEDKAKEDKAKEDKDKEKNKELVLIIAIVLGVFVIVGGVLFILILKKKI
jgi:hypothetical protein